MLQQFPSCPPCVLPIVLLLQTKDAQGDQVLVQPLVTSVTQISWEVLEYIRQALIFAVALNQPSVKCCHAVMMAWTQKSKMNKEVSGKKAQKNNWSGWRYDTQAHVSAFL